MSATQKPAFREAAVPRPTKFIAECAVRLAAFVNHFHHLVQSLLAGTKHDETIARTLRWLVGREQIVDATGDALNRASAAVEASIPLMDSITSDLAAVSSLRGTLASSAALVNDTIAAAASQPTSEGASAAGR
eukprot:TRINITY_DN39452_c0_g1_i1.p2 TRINITY_DN39452_c0_g1~~TRINITY_DN39452_c0_g1_i1.p2  ORF type:complete len:133 (+),score=8.21 TRINITY_DN39452_c0_g1_i1:132-530(+)